MNILNFDLNSNGYKFKILNATNGGPWHKRHANDQFRSNFSDYKAARIPYSRNHDYSHNGELTEITDNLSFDLDLFSIVLIREK